MPQPIFHPSCETVDYQLQQLAETHRLTVVAGLWAPQTGRLALVQTVRSANEEPPYLGLKPPQGGIDPGESAAEALLREAREEVDVPSEAIRMVVGAPMQPTMTGGRAREGKPAKAFGVLCGITEGEPDLIPRPSEIARAGWYSFAAAEAILQTQISHPETRSRALRSIRVVDAIHAIARQWHAGEF
jgi:8-oxo-dGTP pyrophosphatase MutT (NUDIX family)